MTSQGLEAAINTWLGAYAKLFETVPAAPEAESVEPKEAEE